ncbi:phage terminase large subunit family protein [Streptomyces albogriseolus]|uniref:phage terminase large subunit family protein n=1 Tax=Streptomyces albogriseolus TaxID=1887 RepID=UPI0036C8328A
MDIKTYLNRYDRRLLTSSKGRIALTKNDPLLFAILYLPHHLTMTTGEQTLSQFHLELIEWAKGWTKPVEKPGESRDCFIAPRSAGKSTWLFLLLPMWAAAHGHIKFIAAFSDSASQAEDHLQSFKSELDTNEALTCDFASLCTPMMGKTTKRPIAQSSDQIIQSNGFVFMAKGIDAKTLGMKVGNRRPDLLLFDDIEPPEATYSKVEAERRLGTVLNAAFPLNERARVAIVGTTTMAGSIIDQLRSVAELEKEWNWKKPERAETPRNSSVLLKGERIGHSRPFGQTFGGTPTNRTSGVEGKCGTKRNQSEAPVSNPFKNTPYPENLALASGEALEASETASDPFPSHSVQDASASSSQTLSEALEDDAREFYESLDPELKWVKDANIKVHYFPAIVTNPDGTEESLWPEFWSLEFLQSIRNTRSFAMNYMNRPVSLSADYWQDADIVVKQAKSYGNTILSLDPAVKTAKTNDYTGIAIESRGDDGKVYVRHAEAVKIPPGPELRDYITELCERFNVGLVYVETNQGGDVWRSILDGVPAKYRSIHQREKKELRATKALDFYRKKQVFHTGHFDTLETQMFGYPKVKNDDVLDAVVSGVLYFLGQPNTKAGVKKTSYI